MFFCSSPIFEMIEVCMCKITMEVLYTFKIFCSYAMVRNFDYDLWKEIVAKFDLLWEKFADHCSNFNYLSTIFVIYFSKAAGLWPLRIFALAYSNSHTVFFISLNQRYSNRMGINSAVHCLSCLSFCQSIFTHSSILSTLIKLTRHNY